MRFTHSLTELFGTAGKVDILRVLSQTEEPLSGRQIAGRAGLSPAAALGALNELREFGVLGLLRRGRAHCYWLDREHTLIRTIVLPAFAAEQGLRQRAIEQSLGGLGGYQAAVLFGSMAREQERWRSDIDLLFVVADEAARTALQQQIDEVAFDVLRSYGNDVSPVILTVDEFRRALAQRQPFLRHVLQEGVVLAGELPQTTEVA